MSSIASNRSRWEPGGRSRSRALRHGFTILEVVVSTVLLGSLMLLSLKALGWSAAERRSAQQRQIAIEEAATAMQRIAATSWDELNDERALDIRLSPEGQAALPGGTLTIRVTPADGEPAAKRIEVEVVLVARSGSPLAPVRLVSWAYQSAKDQGAAN